MKTILTAATAIAVLAPTPANAETVSGPVHPRCHVVTWSVDVYEDEDENEGETAHGGADADYFAEASMRERCPAKPGVRLTIQNGISDYADTEGYDDDLNDGYRVWGYDSEAEAREAIKDHSGLVVLSTSTRQRKVFADRIVVTWNVQSATENYDHYVSSTYRKVIQR